MKKEWSSIKFDLKQYMDTEFSLISNLEMVFDRLEDNICRTLVLATSQYTKYIEK